MRLYTRICTECMYIFKTPVQNGLYKTPVQTSLYKTSCTTGLYKSSIQAACNIAFVHVRNMYMHLYRQDVQAKYWFMYIIRGSPQQHVLYRPPVQASCCVCCIGVRYRMR